MHDNLVTVRLIKPAKDTIISYQGELLQQSETYRLLRAYWSEEMGRVDLGFVVFEPGDYLDEHFYSDRWYNVYALHSPQGQLKGWYCNITQPAVFFLDTIESEDLELDLFVSPDRATVMVLDEDEYAARGIEAEDPMLHETVQAALHELRLRAERGDEPFTNRLPTED